MLFVSFLLMYLGLLGLDLRLRILIELVGAESSDALEPHANVFLFDFRREIGHSNVNSKKFRIVQFQCLARILIHNLGELFLA